MLALIWLAQVTIIVKIWWHKLNLHGMNKPTRDAGYVTQVPSLHQALCHSIFTASAICTSSVKASVGIPTHATITA